MATCTSTPEGQNPEEENKGVNHALCKCAEEIVGVFFMRNVMPDARQPLSSAGSQEWGRRSFNQFLQQGQE